MTVVIAIGHAFGLAFAMLWVILADLIVLPILDIYRTYYGTRMMWFIFATFYASMVFAAFVVEWIFQAFGFVPARGGARVVEAAISFNYTTVLNVFFLIVASAMIWRFMRTGGPAMPRAMSAPPPGPVSTAHEGHRHH